MDKSAKMAKETKAITHFTSILAQFNSSRGSTCKLEGIAKLGGWTMYFTPKGKFLKCQSALNFLARHGITYLGKNRTGHKGYAVRRYDSHEIAKAFVQEIVDRGELEYTNFAKINNYHE